MSLDEIVLCYVIFTNLTNTENVLVCAINFWQWHPFESPDLDLSLEESSAVRRVGMDGKTLTSESDPLKFYKKVTLATFSLMNAPPKIYGSQKLGIIEFSGQ